MRETPLPNRIVVLRTLTNPLGARLLEDRTPPETTKLMPDSRRQSSAASTNLKAFDRELLPLEKTIKTYYSQVSLTQENKFYRISALPWHFPSLGLWLDPNMHRL